MSKYVGTDGFKIISRTCVATDCTVTDIRILHEENYLLG
jgi:hypothetical protein